MDDRSPYATILGLAEPRGVEMVELKVSEGEVHVRVASKVRRIKALARGFPVSHRFRIAINFPCGGPDLYPGRVQVSQ